MLTTQHLAVLGSPIAHSKSPTLHRAAYRVLGWNWSYERQDLREGELDAFLASRDDSWRGLSLTMPLKAAAFAAADELDDDARLTGAVNTLRLNSGPLAGFNTDIGGLVRAVERAGVTAIRSALVLGGGATAASAVAAAVRLGATTVEVATRTPSRARHLETLAQRMGVEFSIRAFSLDVVDASADIVFSTLPGGTPVPERYSPSTRMRALLVDVAYAPWPSAIATHWQNAEGSVVSGLAMLVHQALLQVRIFGLGSPDAELPDEPGVFDAMRTSVGLSDDGIA